MSVSVYLFLEEIEFLESTAKKVLKENYPDGWWIGDNAFARLDVSKATFEQKQILLRRLAGYNIKCRDDEMFINLNEILDL